MNSRMQSAVLAACVLALPVASAAQSSDVTFRVPLNLRQLSSDISRISVYCTLESAALTRGVVIKGATGGRVQKQEEFPVTGGQLVTTAVVVLPIGNLDNPVGKPAFYSCQLGGFSTSQKSWDIFSETSAKAAFRLSPSPMTITGSFNW
ncbi:MAG TPA: hypothetical protein VI485_02400 [Vicinamibacterales bacterium]|nr:hypothetical protein [Vicinamibacterales bacterium]